MNSSDLFTPAVIEVPKNAKTKRERNVNVSSVLVTSMHFGIGVHF